VKYVKIEGKKETIGVEPWPHLIEVIRLILQHRLLIIVKAKQVGISWLLAAYGLWVASFQVNANILLMSKGEEEAKIFLGKMKFIHANLPSFLALEKGGDPSTSMTFPILNSRVRVLASTQGAGLGETASLVIADEWDFHPYAEANYANVKPTIDAGGQMIGVSTINQDKTDSFFRRLYHDAKRGDNNFTPFFIGWNVRPDRDSNWRQEMEREYSHNPWQLKGIYPSTEEEAFALPEEMSYFSVDALNEMLAECRGAVEKIGLARIYKYPIVSRKYVCGFDHSEGKGGDNQSVHILDDVTGEVVAVMASNVTSPDIFASELVGVLRKYNNALLNYERNWAGLVAYKLKELGYTHIYKDKQGREGTVMSGPSKATIMARLAEGVRTRSLTCWDKPTIIEMLDFRRDGDKLRARHGAHDDRVISLALAWHIRGIGGPISKGGIKGVNPFYRGVK
jgi:hypothetical protein